MKTPVQRQGCAYLLFAFAMGLATSLNAQEAVSSLEAKTVRICDNTGCSDRPVDSASFDTSANAPQPPSEKVQSLINLAQNNPKAAYDLGLRYFRGDGVERDSYQALQWMRHAGDHGVTAAQLALGKLYLGGLEEMGADPVEAESWLSKAAAAGNAEAKNLLPQARQAKNQEFADYATREKQRKTWYILWVRSAPYYWHWHGNIWICQHCR